MRVDKVNQNKRVGVIKFNSDKEIDLIEESMNLLIKKQEETVSSSNSNYVDRDEVKKLERYKKSKEIAVEMPKMEMQQQNIMRKNLVAKVKAQKGFKNGRPIDVEDTDEYKAIQRMKLEGEGQILTGNVEVTKKNIYDIVNALNTHVFELEKNKSYAHRNKSKYQKLQQLLEEAQQQKAKFERVVPKPRGWGRLRR